MAKIEIKISDIDTQTREIETWFSLSREEIANFINADLSTVKASMVYASIIINSLKDTQRTITSGKFDRFLRINSPNAKVKILIYDKDNGGVSIECSPTRSEMSDWIKKKGISPAMVYALEALDAVVIASTKNKQFSIIK